MNQPEVQTLWNQFKGHKGHLTRAIKAVQRQVNFIGTLQNVQDVAFTTLKRDGDNCLNQRDKSVTLLRQLQDGQPNHSEHNLTHFILVTAHEAARIAAMSKDNATAKAATTAKVSRPLQKVRPSISKSMDNATAKATAKSNKNRRKGQNNSNSKMATWSTIDLTSPSGSRRATSRRSACLAVSKTTSPMLPQKTLSGLKANLLMKAKKKTKKTKKMSKHQQSDATPRQSTTETNNITILHNSQRVKTQTKTPESGRRKQDNRLPFQGLRSKNTFKIKIKIILLLYSAYNFFL